MSVQSLFDLTGKTAIVTGGSRGIGLQMASALGEMGAKVALTARKENELDAARAELERGGVECLTIAGDLSDFGAIPGMASASSLKRRGPPSSASTTSRLQRSPTRSRATSRGVGSRRATVPAMGSMVGGTRGLVIVRSQ